MNRHSIFFKLNLLFALALAATLGAGFVAWQHLQKQERMELRLKGRLLLQHTRKKGRIDPALLEELGLRSVPVTQSLAKRLRRPLKGGKPGYRHRPRLLLLRQGSELHLLLRTREGVSAFVSPAAPWQRYALPVTLFTGFLLLLAFIYLQLRRSLKPLERLEADIRRYGEGKVLRPRPELTNGNDEIARLARAFYEAEEKLRRLADSRRLFLRNILHELNTPVTKGKLLAEISEEPRTREMLHSIFGRLSLLLEELAQVERITASGERPERRPVRIVDLIDQAKDRLYLEEPIPYEGPDRAILADFASMAIVFKNLIDNGNKYGKGIHLRFREDRLEFVSEGEPLAHGLAWYLKPFSREENRTEGFGLGLYIVHEILSRQGMALSYRHEKGANVFSIGPLDFAD